MRVWKTRPEDDTPRLNRRIIDDSATRAPLIRRHCHSILRREPKYNWFYLFTPPTTTDRPVNSLGETARTGAARERTGQMLAVLQESFWERLSGVVRLKRLTFEAIQRDPEATSQSWWIVVFLGLANGIAWIVTPLVLEFPGMSDEMARDVAAVQDALTFDTAERQITALVVAILLTILSWYLSSWLLRVIGNRVAGKEGRQVTAVEMRRLVAWGYSPSLASFLTPIPVVGPLLATLGALWAFVTGVMAVRIAFGVGIWKAVGIEIAAFLFLAVLVAVIAVVLSTVMIASSLA